MNTRLLLLPHALAAALAVGADSQVPGGPDTVVVQSGALTLRALLWRPHGRAPFPAVLFNHGSGHATGIDPSGRQRRRDRLRTLALRRQRS